MFVVFEVAKANARKAENVFKDDLVSRQSIVVRESRALGIKALGDKDVQYILIEGGSPEALERAKTLFKDIGTPLPDNDAKLVRDTIHEQDDTAATGVGMIFGD